MKRLALFAAVGVLGHVLTAPLSDVLFATHVTEHFTEGTLVKRLGTLLFFTSFSTTPMLVFGGLGALLQRYEAGSRAVRWMLRAGGVTALVSSPLAQLTCWSQLHTDAQAALLFLFLPLWAALLSGAAGAAGLVLGAAFPGPPRGPALTAPGR
jgi:hypothetical protein